MAFAYGWRGPNIVKDGLVFYLDSGSPNSFYPPTAGTTWKDISGNALNGTLINGTTYNSNYGGGISFDGIDDYVALPNILSGTGDFTVTQFIKSDLINGGTTFCNYPGNSYPPVTGNLQIFYGILFMGMWLNNNSTYIYSSPDFTTSPTMITGLRSGTTTGFYIGDVLKQTGSSSSTIGDSSQNFRIGSNTIDTELYRGDIYITLVYNRALSQQEITQNYNATKGRFGL